MLHDERVDGEREVTEKVRRETRSDLCEYGVGVCVRHAWGIGLQRMSSLVYCIFFAPSGKHLGVISKNNKTQIYMDRSLFVPCFSDSTVSICIFSCVHQANGKAFQHLLPRKTRVTLLALFLVGVLADLMLSLCKQVINVSEHRSSG